MWLLKKQMNTESLNNIIFFVLNINTCCAMFANTLILKQNLRKPSLPSGKQEEIGMMWVEGGGGAVAVVDLGDAERWLRPLHGGARAPLLLWRAPVESTRGCAPHWLENQRGYLLTSTSYSRLNGFILNDTAGVIEDHLYSALTRTKAKHLQLNSRSPITVTLSSSIWRTELDVKRSLKEIMEEDRNCVTEMWRRHQSFRMMLVRENENGAWTGNFLDPVAQEAHLKHRKTRNIPEKKQSQLKRKPTANEVLRHIQQIAEARSWNMAGSGFVIFIPRGNAYEILQLKKDVQVSRLRIFGYEYRWLNEIRNLLNCHFVFDEVLQNREKRRRENFLNSTELYARAYIHALRALAVGNIDFAAFPIVFFNHSFTTYNSITAYMKYDKIVVVVPKASPLPTWTLLIRGFGSDMWLAILGCVVAYALAWRVVARESLAGSVVAALRAFSSCGGAAQERVSTMPQRLQLAGALLGSAVVIVAAYQGRLFQLISLPEHGEEINTYEQLAESDLPLISHSRSILFPIIKPDKFTLSENELRVRRKIASNAQIVSMQERMNAVFERKRVALATIEADWYHANTFLRISNHFHLMEKLFEQKPTIRNTRRNWPWLDAVNIWTLRFQAAGLMNFWYEDYKRWETALHRSVVQGKYMKILEYEDIEEIRVFSLKDILPHYYLLGVALTISVFIFFIEIFKGVPTSRNKIRKSVTLSNT